MKRVIALGTFMIVAGCVVAAPVFAHGEQQTTVTHAHSQEEAIELRKQKLEEALEAREQKLEERSAKRCEFIKSKLQFHREKAGEIREHRAERYQNIIDRLDALADRLDNQGIDSSGLRAAIQQLNTIIGTYSSSFIAFDSELQSAIISACDDNEITKEEAMELRALLNRLRRNAETVHTFVREDLKPALDKIKSDIRDARQENASSQSEESTSTSEMTIEGTPESETDSDMPSGN